ncbi:pro-resilin-like [Macrobrachium nipponense]|uniref:pro-resilin-like n=1 Tax=Macrobrachium nipponense TaxID=159736 RepID=UPI0030C7A8BB
MKHQFAPDFDMNAKILFAFCLAAIVAADKRPARPSTSYGLPQVASAPRPSRPSTAFGVSQVQRPSFDSFENSFERSSFERPSFSRSFDRSFERSFERHSDESFESPKYNFQFGVHDDSTSASFEHQEARDDDETQGSYTVQLPDGRLQTVRYFVNGGSGYVAEVTYEGEARYPDSSSSFESREFSAPRPSYSAPRAQRPRAQRPRPSFTSFDSRESREFFSAPSTSYGVPQ